MYVLMILITVIVAIILIAGLIEPSHAILWGYFEDKTRKNVLKYFGTSLLICLALLGITHRMAVNEAQKEIQQKVDQQKKIEKEKHDKEIIENQKYRDLFNSNKTYENMTTDERNLTNEMLTGWDKIDNDFKSEYKIKKETLEKSKSDYLAKTKAEAEAKAKEEAAKKAEEEKIGYDTGITYEQLARTPDDYKGKKAKFSGKVIQVVEGDKETDLRIAVEGNSKNILFVAYKSDITSKRVLEGDYVTVSGKSTGIYKYKSTMGGQISVPSMLVEKIEISNK